MKQQESILQSNCVKWFRYQYPKALIFAVPNGGSRNLIEAKKLKKEGVMAGVSDLIVVFKNRMLFIEMKTEKGRQSKTQKEFQNRITALGYEYHICRNFDEFKSTIENN